MKSGPGADGAATQRVKHNGSLQRRTAVAQYSLVLATRHHFIKASSRGAI